MPDRSSDALLASFGTILCPDCNALVHTNPLFMVHYHSTPFPKDTEANGDSGFMRKSTNHRQFHSSGPVQRCIAVHQCEVGLYEYSLTAILFLEDGYYYFAIFLLRPTHFPALSSLMRNQELRCVLLKFHLILFVYPISQSKTSFFCGGSGHR
jgi:hypothetical protein